MRGGVACGAASDGSAGRRLRKLWIRSLNVLAPPRPTAGGGGGAAVPAEGPLLCGCASGTGFADTDSNPRAGLSSSKPEPPSGSPPNDESETPPDPLEGGSGCRRAPLPEPSLLAAEGGGTAAPPPDPTELTLATALATPLDPELPADAADSVPASAAAPPASAPTAPAPIDATATPALPSMTPVEIRSPPVKAGAPPRTAANSFGICQHSIMKIIAAPITSNAVMLG